MTARAERRRSRGGAILAIVIALLALAAIALLVMRPARVTGVSQNALEASVGRTLGSTLTPTCDELRGERWSCVAAESGEERGAYLITIDDWGCWQAKAPDSTRAGATPPEACISVRDFIDIDTEPE